LSGSRHVDTTALHKASKIIIVTLLKTVLNVPARTLAESPATASARRAVHSDAGQWRGRREDLVGKAHA